MYMGIASLVLSFAIGSLVYLSIKINRDIKRKFMQEEDEESDDDEDKDQNGEVKKQSWEFDHWVKNKLVNILITFIEKY